jgi:hypothetical protein
MLLELPASGPHGSRAVARTERQDVCAVPVRSGMPGALSRCKSGDRSSDMGVQGWALLRILVDELRHVPQRCDGLYHRSAVSPLQPRSAIWSSRGLGSTTGSIASSGRTWAFSMQNIKCVVVGDGENEKTSLLISCAPSCPRPALLLLHTNRALSCVVRSACRWPVRTAMPESCWALGLKPAETPAGH